MTVQLAGHVAWRELAGETFVVDLKQRRMYGLNRAGSEVWKAICEERDPGNGQSGAGVGVVRRFLGELFELGLVNVSGSETKTAGEEGTVPEVDESSVPRVVWREDLHAFAASCGLPPGSTPTCNQVPQV